MWNVFISTQPTSRNVAIRNLFKSKIDSVCCNAAVTKIEQNAGRITSKLSNAYKQSSHKRDRVEKYHKNLLDGQSVVLVPSECVCKKIKGKQQSTQVPEAETRKTRTATKTSMSNKHAEEENVKKHKRGRPTKKFIDTKERQKRSRVQPLLKKFTKEELAYATQMAFQKNGQRTTAKLVSMAVNQPKEMQKELKKKPGVKELSVLKVNFLFFNFSYKT